MNALLPFIITVLGLGADRKHKNHIPEDLECAREGSGEEGAAGGGRGKKEPHYICVIYESGRQGEGVGAA